MIGRALEAMPFRDAAPVLARLQQQIAAQQPQITAQTKQPEPPAPDQK